MIKCTQQDQMILAIAECIVDRRQITWSAK